ncbi:MDR family MFS transporter [Sandaracinobacteroides saxicola]|uniref:MDR family MFS transporter n=1 Tax=Sandaracinobacteroides saxicola TaxID=2759707 RepID=UPI001A9C8A26|nr:MDR family MFS transporter [Sandaracinobacteroides saxicola]
MHALPELTPGQRRLSLFAVMVVLFLSALDQTIVATAMPRIIADLQGLERYAWVGTAYLLTGTVTVPIYGKLGDLYGRRPIIVLGVLIFLAGSMLCGLAGEFGPLPVIGDGMNQLILFRAIQGIGAGALATGAFATVADLFPPAERGKYAGLFGALFGLASVAGPLLGGWLTDNATVVLFGHVVAGWRWVFYVNLPLGVVALFVLMTKLPNRPGNDPGRIDWAGAGMLLATFVPLLLALSIGGHVRPWGSPEVVGLFLAALLGLGLLLWVEQRADNPVVPLALFGDPVFTRANLALFLMAMAFMGIAMFFPLYAQLVWGLSATAAGSALLPLMGGLLFSSIVCGRLASRTRQYKPLLVGGGVVLLIGIFFLAQIGPETGKWDSIWRMVLVGLGLGPGQGLYNLAVQNSVLRERIGVATASGQFFRQIGSTIGVAVFGALLVNGLARELPLRAPLLGGVPDLGQAQALAMHPERLDAATRVGVIGAFDVAVTHLFWVALGLAAVAFVVTLTIPARTLRGRDD